MSSFIEPHSVVENTDLFLFDCDGVIWKGGLAIPGAADVIDKLRKSGKMVKFVTNNSLKSRAGFVQKFLSLGIHVEIEDMFSSSYAAAAYLTKYPMGPNQKAFVVGYPGVDEELALHNIPHIPSTTFRNAKIEFGPGVKIDHDPNVGAVIVGGDFEFNYYKIQYAQLCLNQNAGCRFIATNTDRLAHITDAQEWAEAGATVGAISGCTGQEPIIVGKPSAFLVDHILEKFQVRSRDRICMVGDNLDTDILFGLNNGLKTVLVLSGVTKEEQLKDRDSKTSPHYVCNSIRDLI